MSFDPNEAELGKQAQRLLRFLIEDHAFSTDFLITAVQEYFHANTTQPKNEAIDD